MLFGREDRLTPAQTLLRISEYLDLETKQCNDDCPEISHVFRHCYSIGEDIVLRLGA